MNLLAHAVLSGERPGVIVGGVMGDWIKGPVGPELPAEIAEGVRRHRRVDVFTDAHPVTARSRGRLQPRWGRYAGILVDLAYDFCLAAQWRELVDEPLESFVRRVHGMLTEAVDVLPSPAALIVGHLVAGEWLLAGRSWEGVGTALTRVARRLRHPMPLGEGVDDLRRLESELAEDFREFFPELRRQAGA